MAEEEAGFTFVDKRRAQAEAPVETPVAAAPEPLSTEAVGAGGDADDDLDDELAAGGVPSTYDLIGYCINLLSSQAWQKLGLLADPQTGEAQPDLAEAKVAIDAVGDLAARLETAPETVISADMRRDLRTLLNDLRLNYVSQRGPSA
jgi:hypothetical protein